MNFIEKWILESKIRNLRNEINELQEKKIQYRNMNNKVNSSMKELNSAKQFVNKAAKSLRQNYTSDVGMKKSRELENESIQIENIIKILKEAVLLKSERKITQIQSQIEQKYQMISNYNYQLYNDD